MMTGTEKQAKFAQSLIAKYTCLLTYDADTDFFEKGENPEDVILINKMAKLTNSIEIINLLKDAELYDFRDNLVDFFAK